MKMRLLNVFVLASLVILGAHSVMGQVTSRIDATTFVNSDGTSTVVKTREILTANRTFYVRTDGSDSNTGLTNSSSGAFLTIQAAANALMNLDCGPYNVTIQIGDGTYSSGFSIGPVRGYGTYVVQGNMSNPTAVFINSTATAVSVAGFSNGTLYLQNFKVASSTGSGVQAYIHSSVGISGIDFGTCAIAHVLSTGGSEISYYGDCSISGGAAYHWNAIYHGRIIPEGRTITISGTPNFSQAFALASTMGLIRNSSAHN